MTQHIVPNSDIDPKEWTVHGAKRFYIAINGSIEDDEGDDTHDYDATYIRQARNHHALLVGLAEATDPGVSTGHKIRAMCRLETNPPSEPPMLQIELRQDGALIATLLEGIAQNFYGTTYEYELTDSEADAIADYAALELWISVLNVVDNPVRVTAVELLLP